MTLTVTPPSRSAASEGPARFRLNRAGILNVWQYDEQEFSFADGRLLLRGANGAGKSKTLEMLLPFALDGDKARITASAKHHTSLLWLMTDGYPGQTRVGYVWVEFVRRLGGGAQEAFTCGVGIRASASARTATAWHFATGRRVGHDLALEDDAGPLSRGRLAEVLREDGVVFDKAAAYKEHLGRVLFGLDAAQYDEVLRLLYWLRQPQVGEDIEPGRLAAQLSLALPQLDDQSVRSAGDTFDELTAFGEQLERRAAAASSLTALAGSFTAYARAVVADRARSAAETLRTERRLRTDLRRAHAAVEEVSADRDAAVRAREAARTGIADDEARRRALEDSPEFRDQRRLAELTAAAERDTADAQRAERRRDDQARQARRRGETAQSRARAAATGLAAHAGRLHEVDRRLRRAVPGSLIAVPSVLDVTVDGGPDAGLGGADRLTTITDALTRTREELEAAGRAVRHRSAAVELVRQELAAADVATAAQQRADREADQAETRWERARTDRVRVEQEARGEHDRLVTDLAQWMAAAPGAPAAALPEELTEDWVSDLPSLARRSAAPRLADLQRLLRRAETRLASAQSQVDRLTRERTAVEAERDPAPPLPVLPRTQRPDGVALWQVVDFAPHLDEADRVGVEAALQASGMLDAWLRPGGLLLEADRHDVVLLAADAPSAAPTPSPPGTLAELLVVDVPPGCDVAAADVAAVLAAVGAGERPDVPTWVAPEGTWRLGPAHGRAAKDCAQFIGATARDAERRRRLAALDAALSEQRAEAADAGEEREALREAVADLDRWISAVPSGHVLLRAWTRAAERRTVEEREEADNRLAQESAARARAEAARARDALAQLAAEQGLPFDRTGLDSVDQELRGLQEVLRESVRGEATVRTALDQWADAVAECERTLADLENDQRDADEAARRAGASRAAAEELRAAVGDTVLELQRRIEAVRAALRGHQEAERDAETRLEELIRRVGQTEADARNAEARLAGHLQERSGAVAALVAVHDVPGLAEAAGVADEEASALAALAAHPVSEPLPRPVVTIVDALAALTGDDVPATRNRVWKAHGEATSGPAADHQPVVAEFADLITVTGRDDGGEATVVALAARVEASIGRDRELLTERERRQFEQHVLGELGDAIRRCRRDAEELVAAMNDQLALVTTSQGIRVRLDWRLREDVPSEAAAAVRLLAQPVGALVPEERASLRDALHSLIEASRRERPELSYGEHLAAALDYRTWSEFTIRYTRPERPGQWDRLHRRSALSQGEQKVLCYLPLFAAAAAHFTSLAGASPHAPRLVLLDDAFPKIDVRTHPLLFGLLVQLDLDFVITSERLWGTHDTVPALAIYEALRDPNERGIAQYEHRWDGRVLQSIG